LLSAVVKMNVDVVFAELRRLETYGSADSRLVSYDQNNSLVFVQIL